MGHRSKNKQFKGTHNYKKIDYGSSFLKIKKILVLILKSFGECYAQQNLLLMFWINEKKSVFVVWVLGGKIEKKRYKS